VNATHQLLVYTEDVKMLGENTNTRKKNTAALLKASREVGLEVNAMKTKNTKHIVVSHHQNVGQNHNLLIHNKSCKSVAKFKYFQTRVTNENCIHKEIKSRLNSQNASYHSVQNLLSSCFVSKNLKIK
jgi:hypothetical protein